MTKVLTILLGLIIAFIIIYFGILQAKSEEDLYYGDGDLTLILNKDYYTFSYSWED